MLATLLGHLLNFVGDVRIVANVLLYLIQGNQRAGKLAIMGERTPDRLIHLVVGNILNVRELLFE